MRNISPFVAHFEWYGSTGLFIQRALVADDFHSAKTRSNLCYAGGRNSTPAQLGTRLTSSFCPWAGIGNRADKGAAGYSRHSVTVRQS